MTDSSNLQALARTSHRVLLLQGPVGPFFADLASWLMRRGAQVWKVNFNAGDRACYPHEGALDYTGTPEQFPAYLDGVLAQYGVDTIVCFGDSRRYHRQARQLAAARGVTFWAFEEGYLRPHFITLERDGVNDHSPLPRDADFYRQALSRLAEPRPPRALAPGFWPMARRAMRYYWAMRRGHVDYPHYRHHREQRRSRYLAGWALSGVRKLAYRWRERTFAGRVRRGELGRFFVLPLQVYDDTQVRRHGDYASIAAMIRAVLRSFALHAPAHVALVVKHHPMDRGFVHYGRLIDKLVGRYQLEGRVHYVHDVPLPVLLRKTCGMVTLNSTSGLSALIHHVPVKVLGRAHYDIPPMTCAGPLDGFWAEPGQPDMVLFNAYRLYQLNVTQINGSFYGQVDWPD